MAACCARSSTKPNTKCLLEIHINSSKLNYVGRLVNTNTNNALDPLSKTTKLAVKREEGEKKKTAVTDPLPWGQKERSFKEKERKKKFFFFLLPLSSPSPPPNFVSFVIFFLTSS